MKQDYGSLRERLDEKIREGHGAEARRALLDLIPSRIPREYAADFANLARRVRLPKLAAQILRPIVRPDAPVVPKPTPKELAAYAAALSRLGAVVEALEVLLGIKSTAQPDVPLFIAFAYIFRWEYSSAIPWLETYLRQRGLSEYERLVGQINLAASLAAERRNEESQSLIETIIARTTESGWNLLAMNAFDIRAQIAITEGAWSDAKSWLEKASGVARANNLDDRFIRKWQAIVELKTKGPVPQAMQKMKAFRSQSLERRDWETVRLCDYYLAVEAKDPDLFARVYAGTPYSSFRKKMEEERHEWFQLPERHAWKIGGDGAKRSVDVLKGLVDPKGSPLKSGQGPHRLLMALTQDFFRPTLVGTLFSQVYPGEYLNPSTSPKRIEQLAIRLRSWFKENRLPLAVELSDGSYRLVASGPIDLVVPLAKGSSNVLLQVSLQDLISELKRAKPYKAFTSKEASDLLGLELKAARKLLKDAADAGALLRIGKGRATFYRFSK